MSRKAIIAAVSAGIIVLAAAAVALLIYRNQLSGGVQGSSTVEFKPKQAPRAPQVRGAIEWSEFGFGPTRTHVGPVSSIRPPFRTAWLAGGNSLLEFPPAVAYGRLFVANAAGDLIAVSTRTGARAWTFKSRRCAASSPAVGRQDFGTVYESLLARKPCHTTLANGEVVAVSAGTGKLRWRTTIGPTESSPLLVDHSLFVGDWRGEVYAIDSRNGHIQWTFKARGAIKAALTISGDRLFVGSYDGYLYALSARTGRLIWRGSSDARLFGHGTFYSSPAVGYGRVYIGSTDHRVYSYGASTGKRRWSYVTGGYVYGSPALWNDRVLIGSYDHYFYALDAATGVRVWRFHADGPISGSATVLNNIVYFATLTGHTYALDSRTGHAVWSFPDGKYASVTTDGKHLFVLGYAKIYALSPRPRSRRRPRKKTASTHATGKKR